MVHSSIEGGAYLVIDTFICTEGLDPVALLLTTGNTDNGLTSDNVLGDLNKDGSDGTAHEYMIKR